MKKFKVGQKYEWTDWFTGGSLFYTVEKIEGDEITLSYVDYEIDGTFTNNVTYKITTDDNGNESILKCEYHGHKGYINAL